MKIINLIENTEGAPGCIFAHGLSFYVETANHKLLMDIGPSQDTLKNAETLGVDIKSIDTVVLSHGHYDHSGGIMPFSKVNDHAVIYMQKTAPGEYYADDGEGAPGGRYRYIGIDKAIADLPQVRFIEGDTVIDDELEIFVVKERTHELPSTNKRILMKRGNEYIRDDFRHEHFPVVRDKASKKSVLISGCAHTGILSILDAYVEKFGACPDAVISGFHLMKKTDHTEAERNEIRDIARELMGYPAHFYTCHCTGVPAYELMKEIMGDRLTYVHSGEEVYV